jgi:hypothetical protein
MKKVTCLVIACSCAATLFAQQYTPAQELVLKTGEDSLNAGLSKAKTVISGYGSAFYQRDFNEQKSRATLERVVLFVGHQFNSKISFFSEMELENAKVAAGEGSGFDAEISMEQAFLKFDLNPRQYFVAGLFTPRIGILNENHLPVNFNGVERPIVEQLLIPATWRELGLGFYGRPGNLPLNYSVALITGLNSAGFEHGSGIRGGRGEGANVSANNLALTASVQYFLNNFRFQVSGYAGGTNGLNKRQSDSLELSSGAFALPLYLTEANVQWSGNGFSAKGLASFISFPDASSLNRAYASNISRNRYGAYAELAYNLFENSKSLKGQELNLFARYEILDLNQQIPKNGIYDGKVKQENLIVGLSYLPIHNVVIKTDLRILHTGPENPALVVNPSPVAIPYKQGNSFFNLGIGYSF